MTYFVKGDQDSTIFFSKDEVKIVADPPPSLEVVGCECQYSDEGRMNQVNLVLRTGERPTVYTRRSA